MSLGWDLKTQLGNTQIKWSFGDHKCNCAFCIQNVNQAFSSL